jgi:hypothetical protein
MRHIVALSGGRVGSVNDNGEAPNPRELHHPGV